jgi:hypothetical protein
VLVVQQTKQNHSTLTFPFLFLVASEDLSRKVFRSDKKTRAAPSELSLIKPSSQIQVVRPEKPKRCKTSINYNISLNHAPKG